MNSRENGSKPAKIIIIGASGLLGSAAVMELTNKHDLSGTFLKHRIHYKKSRFWPLDICDKAQVRAVLDEAQPTCVFQTAAAVNIDQCEESRDWAYKTNVEATRFFSEYCALNSIKHIFVSTDAFYNKPNKLFTEEDEPTPLNYYSETKLLADKAVLEVAADHLIIRTNFYGWNMQNKESLGEWMYFKLKNKQPFPAVFDVFYTPILNTRLVHLIEQLWIKDARVTFNVGGSKRISKLEFAQMLCEVFGFDKSLIKPSSVADLKLKARRSSNMAMSTEKLCKFLGVTLPAPIDDLHEFKRQLETGYVDKLKAMV